MNIVYVESTDVQVATIKIEILEKVTIALCKRIEIDITFHTWILWLLAIDLLLKASYLRNLNAKEILWVYVKK